MAEVYASIAKKKKISSETGRNFRSSYVVHHISRRFSHNSLIVRKRKHCHKK